MGGGQTIPAAPDAAKSYAEGLRVYLDTLPGMLNQEERYRQLLDPRRVAAQQQLQAKYGPTQAQQQLDILNQIDPEGQAVRRQLGTQILGDLKSGYAIPAGYRRELEQDTRRAQAARGNTLGNAPAAAEAISTGKAALDLYQQHLDNAGQFLHAPTPEQQMLTISSVSPDRSAGYVNPQAGYQGQQFALANYQNLLSQYQLAGGSGGNAWQRALKGASIGASQGGTFGGGWGALGGAIGGGESTGPLTDLSTSTRLTLTILI